MTAEKELKNCTFAKTVLMILIVLYHSILFWTGSWLSNYEPVYSSQILGIFAKYLSSLHIYAFALISGYIFYFIKFEKGGYNKLLPFIKNKLTRLIVPYIFVSLIWLIPFYIFVNNGTLSGIVNKYLLAISPDQLWFLVMLFVVFIMAFLMCKLWKEKPVLGLTSVLAVYLLSIVGPRIIPNVFEIWTSCSYLLMFYIGFKLRQYSHGENKFFAFLRKIPSIVYVLVHLAVFLVSLWMNRIDSKLFTLIGMGVNLLTHIMGAVMAFFVLTRLGERIGDGKAFVFLSKVSMPVYLFHQQIIYLTVIYLNGLVNPYLHSGINFAVSFVGSVVISMLLLRFRTTRFLIGEK